MNRQREQMYDLQTIIVIAPTLLSVCSRRIRRADERPHTTNSSQKCTFLLTRAWRGNIIHGKYELAQLEAETVFPPERRETFGRNYRCNSHRRMETLKPEKRVSARLHDTLRTPFKQPHRQSGRTMYANNARYKSRSTNGRLNRLGHRVCIHSMIHVLGYVLC